MIENTADFKECLDEALELKYAYFLPRLGRWKDDNQNVETIVFLVIWQIHELDYDGHFKKMVEESKHRWSVNKNKAWRIKAVNFVNRWSNKTNDPKYYSIV